MAKSRRTLTKRSVILKKAADPVLLTVLGALAGYGAGGALGRVAARKLLEKAEKISRKPSLRYEYKVGLDEILDELMYAGLVPYEPIKLPHRRPDLGVFYVPPEKLRQAMQDLHVEHLFDERLAKSPRENRDQILNRRHGYLSGVVFTPEWVDLRDLLLGHYSGTYEAGWLEEGDERKQKLYKLLAGLASAGAAIEAAKELHKGHVAGRETVRALEEIRNDPELKRVRKIIHREPDREIPAGVSNRHRKAQKYRLAALLAAIALALGGAGLGGYAAYRYATKR